MIKSRKTVAGITLVVIALIGALGFAAWSAKTSLAAFVAQATPAPQTPGGQSTQAASPYLDQFLQALATNLGTTVDNLKSAMANAANSVIDQAQKDGKIDQTQADNLKSRVAAGDLPGKLFFGGPKMRGGFDHEGMYGFGEGGGGVADFASALGITPPELVTELQAGKSIADVAAEKNVDLATVKSKVLASEKTRLDQAVAAQKLTQAQADQMYADYGTRFDAVVNQKGMMGGRGMGRDGNPGLHKGWKNKPGAPAVPSTPSNNPTGYGL